MFYEKKFPVSGRRERKVKIGHFAWGRERAAGDFPAEILVGKTCENCDLSDGRIMPGLGVAEYLTGAGINPPVPNASSDPPAAFAILPYKDENGKAAETVLCVSELGLIHIYNEKNGKFIFTNMLFDDMPKILPFYGEDGTAKLVFCGKNGIWLYERTRGFFAAYEGGGSTAACVFHERVFFADGPSVVRYCAPLNVFDWTDGADEGGYIEFPSPEGEIVGLEAWKECIYVFRKRGIFRLKASGAARDFSAEKLSYGGGNIFKGSIGAVGERIFFLAEDGLYSFDGNKAERTGKELPVFPLPGGQGCVYGCFEDKYLLQYPAREGGKKLLVWNGDGGYFSTAFPKAFSFTEGRILCLSEGKIKRAVSAGAGGVLPSGTEYFFETGEVGFGISGRKFWKRLHLKGEGECLVETDNGEETKKFPLHFDGGEAEAAPLLWGNTFTVRIKLSAGGSVSGGSAVFMTFG